MATGGRSFTGRILGALWRALRGNLPAPLARHYPASQGEVPVRRVEDGGIVHTAEGRYRAVLHLTGEALDDDRAALAILEQLAGAINTAEGEVTLLAFGKPGGLAGALQEHQERVARLEAEASTALPRLPGAATLARAQQAHLEALAAGDARRKRPPVRRYGFYLVLEAPTREQLARLVEEQRGAWGAERVLGREAVAIEAEAWRGTRLPPEQGGLYLWREGDPDGALLEVAPPVEGGASVRRNVRPPLPPKEPPAPSTPGASGEATVREVTPWR